MRCEFIFEAPQEYTTCQNNINDFFRQEENINSKSEEPGVQPKSLTESVKVYSYHTYLQ
jgi:hypothetical protein